MKSIALQGVSVHNLRHIDVTIPYRALTVVSGVSGSGKSSLALDTLYAEGQRRFIESLSAYVRQFLERMERPAIDRVSGMLPAIAIESKNTVHNARSTVGTQTEINDYLRLLFARIGITRCDVCGRAVVHHDARSIAADIERWSGKTILIVFPVSLRDVPAEQIEGVVAELRRQGFCHIVTTDRVVSLDETPPDVMTHMAGTVIDVMVDRLQMKEGVTKRLIDSLERALAHGKGRMAVYVREGDHPGPRLAFADTLHCPHCDRTFREPTPHLFSFNNPMGACAECQGFGRIITVDEHLVVPDKRKSLADGAIQPWTTPAARGAYADLKTFCRARRIPLTTPFAELTHDHQRLIFEGDESFYGVRGFFKYLETKTYKMHVRVFLSRYRTYVTCPVCGGNRLKPEALHIRVREKTITDLTAMPIDELHAWCATLALTKHETTIASAVMQEIKNRVRFLRDVGLGYLTLDRLSRTLSGGEAQRIHLASALGTQLVDTLYVLDEPSVGLHARDTQLLMNILDELKKLGNTIVVIEHDQDVIKRADHVIDMGPRAGKAGGTIVYAGTPAGLRAARASLTGAYLRGEERIVMEKRYRCAARTSKLKQVSIHGARQHNLKDLTVSFPLGQLVVITGVSGSGKSTLLYDVLYNNFQRIRGRAVSEVGAVRRIDGLEHVADMIMVDQAPIGRTPRSNPVTFMDAYGAIRSVFARTPAARRQRMTASHFSFNVDGGRCPVCHGDGSIKVEMHFLADVYMTCDACGGTRFTKATLGVRYQEKTIHEVLGLTVDEAVTFFADSASIVNKLKLLQDIGLGYITLGQPAPTLSAGEAQRLKLALHLAEQAAGNMLFLFDEPTVGLHYHDIACLMTALERLLERGNSIVMIEHNLEVIKCADYLIDLGPEGGDRGGTVVYAGSPEGALRVPASYTGNYLKSVMKK